MVRRHQRSVAAISLVTLLGFLLLLVGCGSAPSSSEPSSDPSLQSNPGTELNPVLRPLQRARDHYSEAFSDGAVVDEDHYQQSLLYSRKARDAWVTTKKSFAKTSDLDRLNRVDRSLQSLVSRVENKRSPHEISRLVGSIRSRLESLPTQNLTPERRGTVRSVQRADRDIEAETQARSVRVGAALVPAKSLYKGSDTVSRADDHRHQLRVWLREVRTKRALPGADITAQFLNGGDTVLSEHDLLETWGPYLFYGQNLTLPEDTKRLRLRVDPVTVGRHGDMKNLLTESFTLEYSLSTGADTARISGPDPEPVPEDYTLGADVQMAVEEAYSLKTSQGYRVGFIAEHSEPFWVYRPETGTFTLANIPRNANRHLEIVLFTAEEYRVVPHAGVRLSLRGTEEDEHLETSLPFLLSAFHHYGNSVYLPEGSYEIKATVERPRLHTLKRDRFPPRVTVPFTWNAEAVNPGSEGEDAHDE